MEYGQRLCLFHTLSGPFMVIENIYSTKVVWLAVQCIYVLMDLRLGM